jgi:hypothetical protein
MAPTYNLRVHVAHAIHFNALLLPCPHPPCNRAFRSRRGLRIHTRARHAQQAVGSEDGHYQDNSLLGSSLYSENESHPRNTPRSSPQYSGNTSYPEGSPFDSPEPSFRQLSPLDPAYSSDEPNPDLHDFSDLGDAGGEQYLPADLDFQSYQGDFDEDPDFGLDEDELPHANEGSNEGPRFSSEDRRARVDEVPDEDEHHAPRSSRSYHPIINGTYK